MPDSETRSAKSDSYVRTVAKGFSGLLFTIALIFVAAGRMDYWQGWVLGGLTVLTVVAESMIFARKPDLVKERLKPGPGTKWWDKVFFAFFVPANFGIVVVGSLDAGRFGWIPRFPIPLYALGYLLFILSNVIKSWAMWRNRFFSSTVRIQADRGQEVIQDGPYRFVRHPGYVSGILLGLSMALVLGSTWALIPAGFVVVLLVVRTYLEDSTLQRELTGYEEYTKMVRYRLLRGVW